MSIPHFINQREKAADTLAHYFARAIDGWSGDNDREIREAVDCIFDCIPAPAPPITPLAVPRPPVHDNEQTKEYTAVEMAHLIKEGNHEQSQ